MRSSWARASPGCTRCTGSGGSACTSSGSRPATGSVARGTGTGIEGFAGTVVHTALWPRDGVDLDGKRVGIIGTGSSGMQAIPHLARAASHLTVFQRTPNYSFPAQVEPVDPELQEYAKANYPEL